MGAWAFGRNSTVQGPPQHSCTLHVGQPSRGQLTNGGAAVDLIDRLQIDVEGEIEMPRQAIETVWPLLRRHGPGQHVDPVAPDDANRQVAAILEEGFADLLWLAMNLPAMRDADIRRQKKIRGIRSGYVRPG